MKFQRTTIIRPIFTTATMLGLAGASSAAVVFGDFTSGTNPIQNYGGLASLNVGTPPVAGTGNWAVTTVAQYWGQHLIQSWATGGQLTVGNLNSYQMFEFDVILPSTGWIGGNLTVELQIETANLSNTTISTVNHNVAATKDQILHFAIDYDSVLAVIPGTDADWINMSLFLRPGYDWAFDGANPGGVAYTPQTIYLDNLTLTTAIPEPSAILLFACSTAFIGLARRR